MENETHYAEAVIDNGSFGTRTIRFETGRLARQAAGSAVAYLDDDTMVLSATTASKKPKDQLDFFPLTVDVEERMYAAGQDPRLLLPPRGPALRGRDPHLPPDRPPAAPVLQEGPAQRDPGRRHDHGAQPRPPVRRRGDQRRLRVHAAGRSALLRPDRRRPRRADQRPVGRVPDAHRARGRRLRHGRRRPRPGGRRRRDHDGRGRGHREDHHSWSRAAPRRRPRRSSPPVWTPRSPSSRSSARPRPTSPPRPPSRPASSRSSSTTRTTSSRP